MREPHPKDWENLYQQSGAGGMLILATQARRLKPLIGKTIAEIATMRGVSPEDAIIDLVIEDEAGMRRSLHDHQRREYQEANRAAVGELRVGRRVERAGGRVSPVIDASARVRKLRTPLRQVRS